MKESIKRIMRIEIGLNEVLHFTTITALLVHMYMTHQIEQRVDTLAAAIAGHILNH